MNRKRKIISAILISLFTVVASSAILYQVLNAQKQTKRAIAELNTLKVKAIENIVTVSACVSEDSENKISGKHGTMLITGFLNQGVLYNAKAASKTGCKLVYEFNSDSALLISNKKIILNIYNTGHLTVDMETSADSALFKLSQ